LKIVNSKGLLMKRIKMKRKRHMKIWMKAQKADLIISGRIQTKMTKRKNTSSIRRLFLNMNNLRNSPKIRKNMVIWGPIMLKKNRMNQQLKSSNLSLRKKKPSQKKMSKLTRMSSFLMILNSRSKRSSLLRTNLLKMMRRMNE